ncbi:Recombinase zinc beta ribbon domain-containing protein, partial [Clostridium cavendishii DSM 21758]
MKLSPILEETEIVKLIFSKYLQLKSISQVVKFLNLSGIKGKNEGEWAATQVNRILTSPIYVKSSEETHNFLKLQGINVFGDPNGHGYLTYNKTKNIATDRDKSEWIAAVAKHAGIINANDWLAIQSLINKNKSKKISRLGTGTSNNALLTGLLNCACCGSKMLVKQGHTSKKDPSIRYDYYVCSKKDSS